MLTDVAPHADDGDVLPRVDEHEVILSVPIAEAWDVVHRHVARSFLLRDGHPLARLLGPEPRSGFELAEESPPTRLVLRGRHHFSRYRLTFELEPTSSDETRVVAITDAAFPGPHGAVYRVLVIRSGAHARIMRRNLAAMRD